MSTVNPPSNPEENPRVRAVFDDIRQTRNTEYVGNLWRYLAFDPAALENVWAEVKELMTGDSLFDAKTREMIYIAVSVANSCSYCIHSHSAAAKAAGMTDGEQAELLRIISLAAKTNHIVTGLQVPVDSAFDAAA